MDLIFSLNDIKLAADWLLNNIHQARCVAFYGEMGAGKTTLINEVCSVLGVKGNLSSPTFSIINEYITPDNNAVYHIDLYRLKDEREAISAGVEDCIYSGQYCFVEWPERAIELFPPDAVKCHISVHDSNTRKLSIIM